MTSPLIFHSRGRTMAAKSGGFQFRLCKLWTKACGAAGEKGVLPFRSPNGYKARPKSTEGP
jgi:hypothetical protein